MDISILEQAILRSQHCQRNWNLNKHVPKEHLDLIVTAASQCPSKQNLSFYNLHVVQDRNIIELIHEQTRGFTLNNGIVETNPQVLANVVILFEDLDFKNMTNYKDMIRNQQIEKFITTKDQDSLDMLLRDKNMAVGIASGYINLVAAILGYFTGFCACFDSFKIKNLLNMQNSPSLIIGIGHRNDNLNRRLHHNNTNFMFPTMTKQPIQITYYK